MATVLTPYAHAHSYFFKGSLTWDAQSIRVCLLDNLYVFNSANTTWANVYDFEIPETGNYTSGGEYLVNPSSTNTKLLSGNVTFSSLTATFRSAVLLQSSTYLSTSDILIAHILFDDTPADITVTGIDFVIDFSNGVFNI